jgi:hypothetical protein
MDPIVVPAPPRSAYNPDRPVSDLLLGQLKHFQHVELKKHGALRIPSDIARDVYTEGGAALYIAAITTALRGTTSSTTSPAAQTPRLAIFPKPKAARKPPATVLDLAASAATTPASAKKPSPSPTKKGPKHSAARKP